MDDATPSEAPAVNPPPSPALRCGNCDRSMLVVNLSGHYGRSVEVDLCAHCHLVWFDALESARLNGPGLLNLIGQMAQAQAAEQTRNHQPLGSRVSCPRCRSALKTVHNQTRWGHSAQLECGLRHGAYLSFAQFLQERGLVRPLSLADRGRLLQQGGIDCLNCGAPLRAADAQCSHCQSVPSLLDVARLARALDPEGATAGHAVHSLPSHPGTQTCAACGAAVPRQPSLKCPQCQATLAVGRLAEVHAQVAALGPLLRAHAERPVPHVVQQRLAAQATDAARRREWIAQMDVQDQHPIGRLDVNDTAERLLRVWGGSEPSLRRLVLLGLAILVLIPALAHWLWA